MKRFGLLTLLCLAGCQEGDLRNGGVDLEPKSFAAKPGELKTVLEELRAKTGWKIACAPELEREIVYLRFKEKTQSEVVGALEQILVAEPSLKDGVTTLDLDEKEDRSLFASLFEKRFAPDIDSKVQRANRRPYEPGSEGDRLREDIRSQRGGGSARAVLDSVMTPSGRAAIRVVDEITPDQFASLAIKSPITWATKPTGSQLPMTATMEEALDHLAAETQEWGVEVQRLRAQNVEVPGNLTFQHFDPRSDLTLTLARGESDAGLRTWPTSTTRSFVATLASHGPRSNPFLSRLLIELKADPAGPPKSDLAFEKQIRAILAEKEVEPPTVVEKNPYLDGNWPTSTFDPAKGDIRVRYLELAVDAASGKSDNVAANLSNTVLWEMTQLPMALPFKRKLDPAGILARDHDRLKGTGFTLYRPKFVRYARMDRTYWIELGQGLKGSRFSGEARSSKTP